MEISESQTREFVCNSFIVEESVNLEVRVVMQVLYEVVVDLELSLLYKL